jgi:hypothetical protein
MTLHRFRHALRILMSFGFHDVAGIVPSERWEEFSTNPHRYFVRADEETQRALWDLIEARQPKPESPNVHRLDTRLGKYGPVLSLVQSTPEDAA